MRRPKTFCSDQFKKNSTEQTNRSLVSVADDDAGYDLQPQKTLSVNMGESYI